MKDWLNLLGIELTIGILVSILTTVLTIFTLIHLGII